MTCLLLSVQSNEDSMKLIGLFRIVGQLVSADSNTRRKARYLFVAKLRGIDLNGVSLEELGLDSARSVYYSDSGPGLEQFLQSFYISPSDVALDLGCGKGGAMITMAKYFSRVDGVGISPRLAEIARNNLRRAHASLSEVYCADATEFTDFDRYTVVYMFNPFAAPVLSQALANLRESLRRRPRLMRLIYRNPVCDDVVIAAGFQRLAIVNVGTQAIHVFAGPPSPETPAR
jgi:SAM-dependent methyltransferase